MTEQYKIYSYDRKRDLKVGELIKKGEQILFYIEDDNGNKCPVNEYWMKNVVDLKTGEIKTDTFNVRESIIRG